MQKKILVIGKGFLGSHIAQEAKKRFDVVCTQLTPTQPEVRMLDVTNLQNVLDEISEINPDYVVNCAARGEVDYLQKKREIAFAVNAEGPRNIAIACKENNARLIHISTDSVFDGKKGNYSETDMPNPINTYAESKLEGESEIAKAADNYVIARTNFYGIDSRGKYFFNWILNSLKSKEKINGFSDVVFSPLDVSTLSKMIIEAFQIKHTGILHLSSGAPISKYDFIIKVAQLLGQSTENIHAISLDNIKLDAPRPKNTSLSNKMALDLLETPIPTVEKWIKENKSEIVALMR